MSYTKGPWEAARNSAYWDIRVEGTGYQPTVASVWDGDEIDEDEQEANAYLIASAPELLEALQAVLSVPGLVDGLPLHVYDAAQNAIAKALGK